MTNFMMLKSLYSERQGVNFIRYYVYVVQSESNGNFYMGLTHDLKKIREEYKKSQILFTRFHKLREGGQVSTEATQVTFRQLWKRVERKKDVSVHFFRYSCVTNLLGVGTVFKYFQGLLRHNRSEITQLCIHIIKKSIGEIVNTLDNLKTKGDNE